MGFIEFLFGTKEEKPTEVFNQGTDFPKATKLIAVLDKAGYKYGEVRDVKARFELFRGLDNQWYFRLKASNNRVICQSEGYTRKSNAVAGIVSVKKNAPRAKVEVV